MNGRNSRQSVICIMSSCQDRLLLMSTASDHEQEKMKSKEFTVMVLWLFICEFCIRQGLRPRLDKAENTNFARLHQSTTIESFKACYKREFLRTPNELYNIENGANMHQTRLRLGLSHLRAHLFQYNLIDNPTCQFCNLEPETTSHYILRCPTYNNVRVRFLIGLTTLLDQDYMASLNDDKIVDLFLHGDPLLNHNTNVDILSMAQVFIVDSKRFSLRILQ